MHITKSKKFFIALILCIIITNTIYTLITWATTNEMNLEKISNPEKGSGEPDGLEFVGNRETSYVWAMATRGDYVYIGTNKNILGNVVQTFIDTMTTSFGLTEDMAWDVVNIITDSEVPRPTTRGRWKYF